MLQRAQRQARSAVFRRVAPISQRGTLVPLLVSHQVPTAPRLLLVVSRGYAKQPPSNGGQNGGFPGFPMFGQQHQKGDALKEYVRLGPHTRESTNRALTY